MIEEAYYQEDGTIRAVIDGEVLFVPDDPDNRHRQMIAAWEAGGGVIGMDVPPPSEE